MAGVRAAAIKPEQYVDPDSIITDWDDVLRLVATQIEEKHDIGHFQVAEFLLGVRGAMEQKTDLRTQGPVRINDRFVRR